MMLLEKTNFMVRTSHQPITARFFFFITVRPIVLHTLNHVTQTHGFLQQVFGMKCERRRVITDHK